MHSCAGGPFFDRTGAPLFTTRISIRFTPIVPYCYTDADRYAPARKRSLSVKMEIGRLLICSLSKAYARLPDRDGGQCPETECAPYVTDPWTN